jgi:2'-5' RNA ligase
MKIISETRKQRQIEREKNKRDKKSDDDFKELISKPRNLKPPRKDLQRRKLFVPKDSSSHEFDYASLSIPVPNEHHEILKEIQKQIINKIGNKNLVDMSDDFHVTVYYGLNNKDSDKVEEIFSKNNLNINKKKEPFIISTSKFEIFSSNDEFDVVVLRVTSDELHTLHYVIDKEFENTGNTFLIYKPHITIAYIKKGLDIFNEKTIKIPKFYWSTNTVEFKNNDGILDREILIAKTVQILMSKR